MSNLREWDQKTPVTIVLTPTEAIVLAGILEAMNEQISEQLDQLDQGERQMFEIARKIRTYLPQAI